MTAILQSVCRKKSNKLWIILVAIPLLLASGRTVKLCIPAMPPSKNTVEAAKALPLKYPKK